MRKRAFSAQYFNLRSSARLRRFHLLEKHENPLRIAYQDDAALAETAKKIAAGKAEPIPCYQQIHPVSRLRNNAAELLHVFRITDAAAHAHEILTPAAQWLADNYHTIDKAITQIRFSWRHNLIRRLPAYAGQNSLPKVFAFAWFYIAGRDSCFSLQSLTAALRAYQKISPLSVAELSAFPTALRFVLVENARRIAVIIEHSRTLSLSADKAADEIIRMCRNNADISVAINRIISKYERQLTHSAFSGKLFSRLENAAIDTTDAIKYLHGKFAALRERRGETGDDNAHSLAAEQNRQAMNGITMGNIIRSLKAIDDCDWGLWFESVCTVDLILREGSDFSALDAPSRALYRKAVEDIAKQSPLTETEIAQRAVALAQKAAATKTITKLSAEAHNSRKAFALAEHLLGNRRHKLEQNCHYRRSLPDYCLAFIGKLRASKIALPVIVTAAALLACVYALLCYGGVPPVPRLICLALAIFPVIDCAFALFNTLTSWVAPPRTMIGYAYKSGIPENAACLIAVPILIASKHTVDEQLRNLEVHYLSNPRGAVYFALLSDWHDAQSEQNAADLQLLEYAEKQTAALNRRYPRTPDKTGNHNVPLFHFLHRRRLWNESESCFMGRERKRGKLHELNRLLRGAKDTSFFPPKTPLPNNIRYVLTLDSDTKLTPGSVAKLVGKLSHPFNSARWSAKTHQITSGYGLLQPRITPSLAEGKNASLLQNIFSGERGLDSYVFAVSDMYQDVAAEGTYTGKGLYEIDVFEKALNGKIAENSVLSHDLLEGGYARTAFVSDVELVEDYPTSYYADTMRRHRWVRGDWQLLPYIFSNSINSLTRWKMLDNLRRSLMPAAAVAALAGGWCLLPAKQAFIWQCVLLIALYSAPFLGILRQIFTLNRDFMLRGYVRSIALQTVSLLAHMLLSLSFLAYSAWWTLDAIIRALFRLLISRKHLLEWRSSDSIRSVPQKGRLSAYALIMLPSVLLACAMIAFVYFCGYDRGSFYIGLPIMLLWLLSPFIAWFCSRVYGRKSALRLKAGDAAALRRIAKRDWAFYEAFVDKSNHFLPPDNFQETPKPVTAQRTSPTNIGLYLLSAISARDFGWISLQEAVTRIRSALHSLDKMEKFRGHIYNWYATDTLAPLEPLYISTVDSGNLAGHLLALSAALQQWADQGAQAFNKNTDSIIDAVSIVEENLTAARKEKISFGKKELTEIIKIREKLQLLRRQATETMSASRKRSREHFYSLKRDSFIEQEQIAAAVQRDIVLLCKQIPSDDNSAASVKQAAAGLLKICRARRQDYEQAQKLLKNEQRQRAFSAILRATAQQAERLAFAMQFGFLENKDRRLLSIGYRVREEQLDESCYDLLASEARLGVLFAIAKGDIRQEHWGRLGRATVAVGAKGALLSWSGSMFEYLMPPLVMQEPHGSLLAQTANLVVRRQKEYGQSRRVPWGISEAAFNARDPQMNYQYSAFGVPSLGLQRGLSRNLVIAPYATVLAATYSPRAAVGNLEKLRRLGALGRYGYYDSVDFTPSRVPQGQSHAVVRNYYAHHHGMSIIAVNNAVHDNIMRRRFHSNACIEAVSLLLQEKAPRAIPVLRAKAFNPLRAYVDKAEKRAQRITERPLLAPRSTQLLSGGAYNLMLTARGTGYSTWNGIAVTRYQADATDDSQGSFFFLRDCDSGHWWSAAAEPTRRADEDSRTVFTAEKAEFYKTVDGIHSVVECLAGESGEARRIKIFNRTHRERIIDIVSYSELALNVSAAENAHPAFSHLFIETEIAEQGRVIFARRRRRTQEEPSVHAAHCLTPVEGEIISVQPETDRRAFIGRGRSLRRPVIFDAPARNSDSAILPDRSLYDTPNHHGGQHQEQTETAASAARYSLDPIFSLRCRIKIPAHRTAELVFWTMAAENREKLNRLLRSCRRPDAFEHEFNSVWTHSQIIRHHIGLTPQNICDYQKYAAFLLFPEKQWLTPKNRLQDLGKQSDLWPMSISGDFPICVLRIANEADLPTVREMLHAHEYWRCCGLTADLVLLNEHPFSYAQDTQRSLEWLAENYRHRARDAQGKDHIFIVRKDQISKQSQKTLLAAAQIVLSAAGGSLREQLSHWETSGSASAANNGFAEATVKTQASGKPIAEKRQRGAATPNLLAKKPETTDSANAIQAMAAHLRYWNGIGGFDQDGSYKIMLRGNRSTPKPWVNIIANPGFGMLVSAEGASFTWAGNSRDYRLTPWSNDAVVNRTGEALYCVDLLSKKCFSPCAAAGRNAAALYETRFGQGYASFASEQEELHLELTHTVDIRQAVRFSRLRISNRGKSARILRVYNYIEWVLGENRAKTAPFLCPAYDIERAAMQITNPYHLEKAEYVGFVGASLPPSSITADRAEFIGATGTVSRPQSVREGKPLSGTTAAGRDICSAMAYDINLQANETKEIIFYLGCAENAAEAQELINHARTSSFDAIKTQQTTFWQNFTGGLRVKSPDESFNLLVNHWLPYQAYACRIMARTGFYQASGAFGFRDQLQDSLALIWLDPQIARTQICAAAARQFKQGDVQHWWLPQTGAGVRTLIADDVVWPAYAAAFYVTHTGDTGILNEKIPFLEGEVLKPGQTESFFCPAVSGDTASLYQHCRLALNLAIKRTGKHGLPLILGGDWNDGLNLVGIEGKGESVWLGWFLGKALQDFIPLARAHGDAEQADIWETHVQKLTQSLEKHGWDGAWYRRAYYDDGTPLGSAENDECRIDSIAQSWSIISGLAAADRQKQAFKAMLEKLDDKEAGILPLFLPPFAKTKRNPGYIKAYPPGIRENGGQYTHGAIWAIFAAAQLGDNETAYRLFSQINPVHHGANPEIYQTEPYVAAADIYSAEQHRGQGGWTWYTGAAGWLYRAAVEAVLGLRKQGDRLFLNPALPQAWQSAELQWKHEEACYQIFYRREDGNSTHTKPCCTLNGTAIDIDAGIPLTAKAGIYKIMVTLPAAADARGQNKSGA